jgi:hypothetical protein
VGPIGGGGGAESARAHMNAIVNRAVLEWNRRDLDEIRRARHLDALGVVAQVSFGLYVEGFGDDENGSLCDAAVLADGIVFLDADESATPDAELGRAPRDGLTLEVTEDRTTLLAQDFPDAPWTIRSMTAPGAVDLRAHVVVRWPAGKATFAFATPDGAAEAVETLRKALTRSPTTTPEL